MRIIAHRGGGAHAPENTFAAFDHALQREVDGIETDVRVTRDGHAVLIHNATVDQTTDGSGLVRELTLEELGRLNAAAHFSPPCPAQRVPTLEAFLRRYAACGRRLCVEVKEEAALEPAVALLADRRLVGDAYLELTSFELEVLSDLREAFPGRPIGWLLREALDEPSIERACELGLSQICPHVNRAEEELIGLAREAGLGVRMWGVKRVEQLQAAAEAGVDAVTLDHLDWWKDGAIPAHVLEKAGQGAA